MIWMLQLTPKSGTVAFTLSHHRFIKHIVSDAKNTKNSLKFMAKYISNKQIEPAKANDFTDLNGIGDAVWNFISSVYESN